MGREDGPSAVGERRNPGTQLDQERSRQTHLGSNVSAFAPHHLFQANRAHEKRIAHDLVQVNKPWPSGNIPNWLIAFSSALTRANTLDRLPGNSPRAFGLEQLNWRQASGRYQLLSRPMKGPATYTPTGFSGAPTLTVPPGSDMEGGKGFFKK